MPHSNGNYRWRKPAKKFPGNPYGSRYVAGDGPVPCDFMLIGEGPGDEENRTGRPFCGLSGQVLDGMLLRSGLQRSDVYVTNVVKYHMPEDANPTANDIRRDRQDLVEEIAAVAPRYIGLIGAVATHQFLPGVILEWAHGIAFDERNGTGQMPMYHPAFGLHSPDQMPLVNYDVRRFVAMCRQRIRPRRVQDAYPQPYYEELRGGDEATVVSLLCDFCLVDGPVSIDTEGYWWNPWGLSFSIQPGRAFVIHRESQALLQSFGEALRESERKIVLHNSLHDFEVLRALTVLGIDLHGLDFEDTMVMAYLAGVEPQGLKPLAKRHCGAEQDDYADIIRVPQLRKSTAYLLQAYEHAQVWEAENCQSKTSDSASSASSKTRAKSRKRAKARSI